MVAISRSAFAVASAWGLGVILAFGAVTGAIAVPSEAPTPAPIPTLEDAVVRYVGPETTVQDRGDVDVYPSREFGVDCRTGVCLLFGYAERERVPRVEVIDGHATFDVYTEGTPCTESFQWARTTTVEFSGDTAKMVERLHGTGVITCPNGSLNEYSGNTSTALGTLVSGNPCFITNTCPTPAPIAAPTVDAIALPVATPPSRAIDEPSILSSLPTVVTAMTVRNLLWATAMAVILALLVAFPKHLLSSAASSGSKRLAKWGEKFTATAGKPWTRLRALVARITSIKGWGAATIGIAIAAIISSFVDPEFGWNAASIRTFLSILVSLALQIATGWLLLIWLVRRTHPSAKAEFEFRPLTLLIVVGAVILSRITEFEPGIIFGLVAGLSFGALSATAERARVALIGLARAFVLSLIAWLAYSLLTAVGAGGPVVVFITETLSALTIAGIVALPIALLPFQGTTGNMLWKWNRRIWAGSYVVGLLGFFLILMPMPFSWKAVPMSLTTWTGLFVAYAAGSVIIWAILVRPWEKEKTSEDTAEKKKALEPVPEEAG